MRKAIINIGDKIELTHVKSAYRRKLSDRTYGSKLLDYDGFREAKVSMPIYEGKIVPLELGDEYDLCFFTSFGFFFAFLNSFLFSFIFVSFFCSFVSSFPP